MQLALSSLDRRLGLSWERAGLAKARNTPVCVVRLDRLEFTATGIAKKQILDIPGFRSGNNHFVRRKGPENFLPYRRVANFESDTSIRKMDVLYEPTAPWIAPFKVTLISHDKTGLQPGDALSILELLPGAKVIRIEVAFDFGYSAGVDGAWVRSHSLFSKARRNQVGIRRSWDAWGSRRGAKFVRSYYKKELKIHRLELQLNRNSPSFWNQRHFRFPAADVNSSGEPHPVCRNRQRKNIPSLANGRALGEQILANS